MAHCDIELQAFFVNHWRPAPIGAPCPKERGGDIGGRLSSDPTWPARASTIRGIASPVATRHARRATHWCRRCIADKKKAAGRIRRLLSWWAVKDSNLGPID